MNKVLTIGVHMLNGWETRRLQGVLQYVLEQRLAIRDFNFSQQTWSLPETPPWLGKVDGVVAAVARQPGIVAHLRNGRVPVVNASDELAPDFVCVCTDSKSVAELAAAHFLDLGRREFAYVGYRHTGGSRERAETLAAVLARHKRSLRIYHTNQWFSGTFEDFGSIGDLEPRLVRLIERAKKPLGVLALNDRWAVAVCRIAQELGLAIPQDVAILGIGDRDLARFSTPPISSIRIAAERIGHESCRLLHRLLLGKRLARRMLWVPALELVPRESTVGKRRADATDVERALEFIRDRACAGIRIEDVAAHVHVPLRTFELQFAEQMGRTVGVEVRRVRLERAKSLLETTDLPLASVAHLLGMNAPNCLTDFFRRWLDTTPAAYRRQHARGRGPRARGPGIGGPGVGEPGVGGRGGVRGTARRGP